MEILSSCVYCGVGCRLTYVVEEGRVIKILPDRTDPVSKGQPCSKGLTISEVAYKNRLTQPMVRPNKNAELRPVTWGEAYDAIAEGVRGLDGREILFIPSGKTSNEDAYVMQKFARVVLKSNNVDGCCSRLCHVNTITGLRQTLGTDGSPAKFEDIATRDCILILGSNPASNHPVLFRELLRAKKNGTKLISVVSIPNETSRVTDIAAEIEPDTEVAFINCLIREIIQRGGLDPLARSVTGFEQLSLTVSKYTCERVCEICRVKPEVFFRIVEAVSSSAHFGIMHGMGLTQSRNGLANVYSLLNLLTAKNGKLLSNRGEINVQGIGDMGCNPTGVLPSPVMNDELEKLWNTTLSKEMGLNMIQALYLTPVKAAFLCDVNIALSLPDLDKLHDNLRKMFVVMLHHHRNATMNFADVVLPIPMLFESMGSVTTGERRVRLARKVAEPVGEAKSAWVIFKELSEKLGHAESFPYSSSKEILKEVASIVDPFHSVNVERLYEGEDQWPVKEPLFRRYMPVDFEGTAYQRSPNYPYVLVTVRSPLHFLHDDLTSQATSLMHGGQYIEFCYLNPDDARDMEVSEGDQVTITSPSGRITVGAKTDPTQKKGVVKLFIHSEKLMVNKLVPLEYTSGTFTPNYKAVSVSVVKVPRAA
jgi:predicted molibdopterin-dependent oxidoreductase YjgC